MDWHKMFLDELRKIIKEEAGGAIMSTINDHVNERWVDKKDLAEYLNVSESWINQNLNDIPHVSHPIRFKRSQVDIWRQSKNENTSINTSLVTKTSKIKNTYRVV